jgi:uncharacterized protein
MPITNEIEPMLRRRPKWRRWAIALVLIAAAVIAVNAVAFMQARAMTHFVDGGERTLPPEQLGLAAKIKVLFTGVRVPRPADTKTPADISLDFQTVRFGGASGGDCEAWYVPAANARRICIEFPGYVASKSSLLLPTEAFHNMGLDVLMVDFRGTGGSMGDRTTLGYDEAEDVAAAVDFARRRSPGEPVILYGQSMGGAAILRAVGELGVNPSAIIIESVFDRLLSTAQNRFHSMGLPAFPLAQLLVFWGGAQIGHSGFQLNPAD